MIISTSTVCWCGTPVCVSLQGGYWHAFCERCYDPTPDAGSELAGVYGRGATPDDALWGWMHALQEVAPFELTSEGEAVALEYHASERVPASTPDLFADLARAASIEAERQRGWKIRPALSAEMRTVAGSAVEHRNFTWPQVWCAA